MRGWFSVKERPFTVFLLHSLLCVNLLFSVERELQEREMVIVIPSYNNTEWHEKNITTAMTQNYQNFHILYINDCSTDGTGEKVEELAKAIRPDSFRVIDFDNDPSMDIPVMTEKFKETVNQERVFFTLVNNTCRHGALANLYLAAHSCEDNQILLTLDGDDWFPDASVLKKLNDVYASGEIWMTHGTLLSYPSGSIDWCEEVPLALIKSNEARKFKCPSHLRTYYAWIFKKIALEDLLYEGKFFPVTGDMAIMFPILEMAAERHAFIREPNYIYNEMNPLNDSKVNEELQNAMDNFIRSKSPYQRIE